MKNKKRNASGPFKKGDAFTSGRLCSNFHWFGAIVCEISTDTRLEHPILAQMFATTHINRVLKRSRVDLIEEGFRFKASMQSR